MRAYHWLKQGMIAASGNEPAWTAGEERTIEGELVLCRHGYHWSPSLLAGLEYAPGPVACLVDVDEAGPRDSSKGVSRRRKLLAAYGATRELRLFACDCAERALEYERAAGREPDPRSWAAVGVTRRYVDGEATEEELAAARDAAWDAARDAEREWQRGRLDELILPHLQEGAKL